MTVAITAFVKQKNRITLRAGAASIAFAVMALPTASHAAGTLAGSTISNTASASYDNGGGTTTITSNPVDIKVDELLDVTVAGTDPGDVATTPGAVQKDYLTFTVTNNGNGDEAFVLGTIATNGGDDYDPTNVKIYIDSDGDGKLDPTKDTLYTPGTSDPVIQPDQSITVFVLVDTPGTVVDGNRAEVVLTAESKTVRDNGNNNTPGFSMAGLGTGGSNAVVGATGADGEDNGFFKVSAATVTLVKTQVVRDQFGGSQPVPGATITYTIVATAAGSGAVAGLVITDPVPVGTTYQPGTIRLGGTSQTDGVDGDAGSITSNIVSVNIGALAGGQSRSVTFDVKINAN